MEWADGTADDRSSQLTGPLECQERYGFAATIVDNKREMYDDFNMAQLIATANWNKWQEVLSKYKVAVIARTSYTINGTFVDKLMDVDVTGTPCESTATRSVADSKQLVEANRPREQRRDRRKTAPRSLNA